MSEASMTEAVPPGLRLTFDSDPPPAFRAALGQGIAASHAETVLPYAPQRFGLALRDQGERLVAGLSAAMTWGWLFVDAVWVDPMLRGQGAGRLLMARAESHAASVGC